MLADLVESGTIHIIDFLFVKKDTDGDVEWYEFDALDIGGATGLDDLEGDVYDLLNEEDVRLVAEQLESNRSAGMIVYENVWATQLRDAIVNANGRLVDNARISATVVQTALDAAGMKDV